MADADVNEHVGEEAPGLVAAQRVVDEHGAERHRPIPRDLDVVLLGQVDADVDEECGLYQCDEKHEESGRAAAELLRVRERLHHRRKRRRLLGRQPVLLHNLQKDLRSRNCKNAHCKFR